MVKEERGRKLSWRSLASRGGGVAKGWAMAIALRYSLCLIFESLAYVI